MANILLLDVWEPVDVLVAEFQTAAQIADPKMEKSDQVPGHAHVVFIDIWKFEFKVFWMSIWELPNIFKTVRLINQARIFKLVFLGLFSQAVITNFCCLFGHNYQFKA